MNLLSLGDVCQRIKIILKNDALSAQRSLQGIYELSTLVNGEQSWTSSEKAIWSYPKKNIWLIGAKGRIGGEIAGVYGRRILETGPDNKEIVWNYSNDGWKVDVEKDIKVTCVEDLGKNYIVPVFINILQSCTVCAYENSYFSGLSMVRLVQL